MSDNNYIVGDVPKRTIPNGIFPFSPRANAREGIFSDALSAVMGCTPKAKFSEEFKTSFLEMDVETVDVDAEVTPETLWNIYTEKYTTETQGGSTIAIPFNIEIPERIEPASSMQWGTWYRLLMSRLEDGSLKFESDLHQEFQTRLDDQDPSNIFEEVVLEVVKTLPEPERNEEAELEPLRPYIPAAHNNFTTDLEAWLNNEVESDSVWLQDCQDLIGIHFFMYYVQVGLNLSKEWEIFTDPTSEEEYSPRMIPIAFGVEGEPAGFGREFVQIWSGERGAEFSVRDEVFDSWGRLAVTRILNEAIAEAHDDPPEHALTLTEAQVRLTSDSREITLEKIYEKLKDENPPDSATQRDVITAAETLVTAIDNHYRYDADEVAPETMGIRGVKRLADAETRYLKRERGRQGYRFQMADETLSFLARVFTWDKTREDQNQTFEDFIEYLNARAFKFDGTTKKVAQRSLNSMGLLEQESDSGESVYVRQY